MVIQRIQTLYLLFAIMATVLFLFFPFGYMIGEFVDLRAVDYPELLVPTIVALAFMVVSVFLFKRMPLQKIFVAISAVIVLAIIGMVAYFLITGYQADVIVKITIKPEWGYSGLLLVAALVALFGAYRNITADQKILRSYDRLR